MRGDFNTERQESRDKRVFRWRLVETYQDITGYWALPSNEVMVTLGGDSTSLKSEFHQLINTGFIHPAQYVNIDLKSGVVARNGRLKSTGAKFIHGEFSNKLAEWVETDNRVLGVVSCDMMCRIDNAIPTVAGVFHTLVSRDFRMLMFNINVTRRPIYATRRMVLSRARAAAPGRFIVEDDQHYWNGNTHMLMLSFRMGGRKKR